MIATRYRAARIRNPSRKSIGASAGYASTRFDSLTRSGTSRILVGPVLTWPLLDLGRVRQRVEIAQAEEDASRVQYTATVLRAVEDPAWVFGVLERLTDRHESGRAMPWTIHDAPRDFIDKIMAAVVGIEIALVRIQGKWKMSQNRTASERVAIAADVPAIAGFINA